MNLDYSYRIGNIEARSCGDHLFLNKPHNTIEIVEWFEPDRKNCYVLAYFVRGKEGYDLRFVGSRPFMQTVSEESFMTVSAAAQLVLDQYFEESKDED